MTKKERASPKIIGGKRRRRIAAGSGTKVQDVNQLLKMHRQMADMMKKMGKNKGMMSKMMGGLGLGGNMMGGAGMSEPTSDMIEQAKQMQKSGQIPALPASNSGLKPKGLPGLGGGGLPGLGGPGAVSARKKKKKKL